MNTSADNEKENIIINNNINNRDRSPIVINLVGTNQSKAQTPPLGSLDEEDQGREQVTAVTAQTHQGGKLWTIGQDMVLVDAYNSAYEVLDGLHCTFPMVELWKKVVEENGKNALGRQGANATTLEQRYGRLKTVFKAVNTQLLVQIQSTNHVLSDLIPFASASGDLKTGRTMDLNGQPFIASVYHGSNKLKMGVVPFN